MDKNYENDIFLLVVNKKGTVSGHISKKYRDVYQPNTKLLYETTKKISTSNKMKVENSDHTKKLINLFSEDSDNKCNS